MQLGALILYLDTEQQYRAGGRVEYAMEAAREGFAAMGRGEYAAAAVHYQESVVAYPHPTALRRLGICLLFDRRPADAVLYLAAAISLSSPTRRTRPLLLLAKAMLTAGNGPRCVKLLRNGVENFPGLLRDRVDEALGGGWRKADLHRLIDELLSLIPQEHDTPDSSNDPPIDHNCLVKIYRMRNADSA